MSSVGFLLFILVLLLIGLRPVSYYYFGDTGTYADSFALYKNNNFYEPEEGDFLFNLMTRITASVVDVNTYILICGTLYVFPLYSACKKIFKSYWSYAFLMLVISLSFWSYGTNGIRNGIATSLFIYALSKKTVVMQLLFFLVALGFHKSLLLPIAGYLLTLKFNTPRLFLIFWFACIPFSLLIGGSFQNLVAGFFEDKKLNEYFYSDQYSGSFSRTGFRWDFLLYSASGVYTGWYFIVKRQFKDLFYAKLYSIYLFSNALWILVIQANFSNRFAYLSWFLLGLVIVYPFIKQSFFKNQYPILGNIIVGYFAVTYILDYILM